MFKIEEISKHRIAYMRQVGPYGADNKKLMEKLKSWASASGLMCDNTIILGIAQDNPSTTPAENCRYDVCLAVSEDYEIKEAHVNEAELSGGRYAVFTIGHTAADIQKAWNVIFPELESQGYQIDYAKPIMERYIPGMVKKHLCEICVPVS